MKEIQQKIEDNWKRISRKTVNVYYIDPNDKPQCILYYEDCRGYLMDNMQRHLVRLEKETGKYQINRKYLYLYCGGTKSIYEKHPKMTQKTVMFMTEMLGMMGFPPPKVYSRKKDEFLVRIDNKVFRNIYAVSLLFTLFKWSNKVHQEDVTTLRKFIFTLGYYDKTNLWRLLQNWQAIFPKSWSWKKQWDNKHYLHGEGIGELSRMDTKFPEVNLAAAKILTPNDKYRIEKLERVVRRGW